MNRIILLLFALVLISIALFFKKKHSDLLMFFSTNNEKNLRLFSTVLIVLALIGVAIALLIPHTVVALLYVAVVLIASGLLSVTIAKNMK